MHCSPLLPLLLCLGLVGLQAAEVDHRRFERQPVAEPEAALDDEAFEQAAKRFRPKAGKKDRWLGRRWEPVAGPGCGLRVTKLVPDSPAVAAGIAVDDLLLAWNGHDFANPGALNRLREASGGAGELTWWSPTTGHQTLQCEPGMIGVHLAFDYDPVRAFRARQPTATAGHELLEIAQRAAGQRPAVAETALHRARRFGCDDPAWLQIYADSLFTAGQPLAALNCRLEALDRLAALSDEEPCQQLARLAFIAGSEALLQMKYPLFTELIEAYPWAFHFPAGQIRSFAEQDYVIEASAAPLPFERRTEGRDLTHHVRVLQGSRDSLGDSLSIGKRQRMFAPAGRYQYVDVGPRLRQPELHVHFDLAGGGGKVTRWPRTLTVALVSPDSTGEARRRIGFILYFEGNELKVSLPHMPDCWLPIDTPKKAGHLRVSIRDSLVQGTLGDTPFLLAPLPPERRDDRFAFRLRACGVSAYINEVTWIEHADEAIDLSDFPAHAPLPPRAARAAAEVAEATTTSPGESTKEQEKDKDKKKESGSEIEDIGAEGF